jgi:hypothetical protein
VIALGLGSGRGSQLSIRRSGSRQVLGWMRIPM